MIMKTKLWMVMTMAALLTAGCSQNEITDMSPDAAPPVGFKVFTDAQTSSYGTVTDNNTSGTGIKAKGFGVFAYYTGQSTWATAGSTTAPNFMYNQQVTWASSAWSYTPMKYWPNTEGDKISFFAYAPYSASSPANGIDLIANNTGKGAPTMRFTLQTLPENMVDLVATDATQNSGANNTIDIVKQTSMVNFKFKHALTRASFKAKLDASLTSTQQTHVIITGMRILGTTANGTGGDASGANSNSKFYNAANFLWNNGTWNYTSPAAAKQSNPYALNSIMPLASQTSIVNAQYTKQGIELPQAAGEVSLFNSNQYLFLIPPADITGISAPTDVRLQLDYDIVTVDPKIPTTGYSITSTSATVSLPNGTLKRASAYIYTFTVGLEKVQVSASVEDWTTDVNTPIPNVDVTTAGAPAISTAIGTLNTTKANNQNCNYFIVNVKAATTGALSLTSATTTNFVSGDKIELNFTVAPNISSVTAPTGWTADKNALSAVGKIILKKN